MSIDRVPSALGLQHMAARAQEVRQQFSTSSQTSAPTDSGKNAIESGKPLPQTSEKTEHATGMERAIERLQLNTAKSPEARGLQQALEMLQERSQDATVVDTVA